MKKIICLFSLVALLMIVPGCKWPFAHRAEVRTEVAPAVEHHEEVAAHHTEEHHDHVQPVEHTEHK